MNTKNFESKMVNLEASMLIRALDHLKWNAEHLPDSNTPARILVVGEDRCLFKERLNYLVLEGGTKISGRPITFNSIAVLDEAKNFVEKNQEVVMIILLSSVSDQWDHVKFVDRPGLLLFGQGKSYLRRGLGMVSKFENNRVKISVNLKKIKKVEVAVEEELLFLNRSFYQNY